MNKNSKHNMINLDEVFEQKMEEWRLKGLVGAIEKINPVVYRSESYTVPDNYYYNPEKAKSMLQKNKYDYVLKFTDLVELPSDVEKILSIAKLTSTKAPSLYLRNGLSYNEGLVLVTEEYLGSSDDYSMMRGITALPKNVDYIFQGVVVKNKLKDLVIDTAYKLDFNKSVKTHYIDGTTFKEDSPISVLRYFNNPMSEVQGYSNISGVVYTKTGFDSDGDMIVSRDPKVKCVFEEFPEGFLFKTSYFFESGRHAERMIYSLEELIDNIPNLMVPEGFLRRMAIKEFVNN